MYPNDKILNGEESAREHLRFVKRKINPYIDTKGIVVSPTIKSTIVNRTGAGFMREITLSLSASANPQKAKITITIDGVEVIKDLTSSLIYNRFQGGSTGHNFSRFIYCSAYSANSYNVIHFLLDTMYNESLKVEVENVDTAASLKVRRFVDENE